MQFCYWLRALITLITHFTFSLPHFTLLQRLLDTDHHGYAVPAFCSCRTFYGYPSLHTRLLRYTDSYTRTDVSSYAVNTGLRLHTVTAHSSFTHVGCARFTVIRFELQLVCGFLHGLGCPHYRRTVGLVYHVTRDTHAVTHIRLRLRTHTRVPLPHTVGFPQRTHTLHTHTLVLVWFTLLRALHTAARFTTLPHGPLHPTRFARYATRLLRGLHTRVYTRATGWLRALFAHCARFTGLLRTHTHYWLVVAGSHIARATRPHTRTRHTALVPVTLIPVTRCPVTRFDSHVC